MYIHINNNNDDNNNNNILYIYIYRYNTIYYTIYLSICHISHPHGYTISYCLSPHDFEAPGVKVRVNALKRAQAQVADAEQRALQEEMLGDGQKKWMF